MHEVTASIEFQMSLLLFIALGGYLLASQIGQPAVVGEILVGIVIGPSVLGWITYTNFVSSMAHLGAIILLFVTGLEFKLKDVMRWRYGVIAVMGIIVPWIGGYVIAKFFDFHNNAALLIGVALSATSIAITADTLREMGKLHSQAAQAIIGAAIIDDVLALMALAVTQQVAAGELSSGAVTLLFVKAAVFIAVGALLGHSLISRIVSAIDDSRIAQKYPEFVFVFAMMAAFFYALIAELIGLSAIVGAFIAGVSFEGISLRFSRSFRDGAEYLRIIFGAIFFVSLGILVNVKALTPELIWFLLSLSVVAILTKVIGCGLPARFLGINNRDSLVIGFGMAPRGEIAMIVALLGLNSGVIAQPSYIALVLMSLLTTLVTPLVLRNWLYRSEFGVSKS